MRSELSRITVGIPKTDHRRLKKIAMQLGTSMQQVVKDAIAKRLCESCEHIPNKKTLKAIQDVEKGKGLIHAGSAEEFFKKLGI